MRTEYIIGLIILVLFTAGLATLLLTPQTDSGDSSVLDGEYKKYVEIANPSGFVNTGPITLSELVGKKVILVDFMTYSCINCQRTFPYLVAWYEKYKNDGLEIIGVHTPEFAFEKNPENVKNAMKEFGITYPVVLDNEYSTWRAYGNNYWPSKYLIDIYGNIVYDHIGEGAYEETEMKIQELLDKRARVLGESNISEKDTTLAVSNISKSENKSRSPETYFGFLRNEFLANGTPGKGGKENFTVPDQILPNLLFLGGTWNIDPEHAETFDDSRIVYRYWAQDVYIVAEADTLTEIEVLQDGKPVSSDALGLDVKNGVMSIQESRLYKIIHNKEAGDHILELRIRGKGVRFYAFTFG
jgi:thiol-disulfide isomerase/thioredoxin